MLPCNIGPTLIIPLHYSRQGSRAKLAGYSSDANLIM